MQICQSFLLYLKKMSCFYVFIDFKIENFWVMMRFFERERERDKKDTLLGWFLVIHPGLDSFVWLENANIPPFYSDSLSLFSSEKWPVQTLTNLFHLIIRSQSLFSFETTLLLPPLSLLNHIGITLCHLGSSWEVFLSSPWLLAVLSKNILCIELNSNFGCFWLSSWTIKFQTNCPFQV